MCRSYIFAAWLLIFCYNTFADDTKHGVIAPNNNREQLIELLAESLQQIEHNYFQPIDRRELIDAAIAGMMTKLDQHSSYITPSELNAFNQDVDDQLGGIGVHLMIDSERLTVVSPIVESPAYRADLIGGDIITHIDDQPTAGRTLAGVVRQLKGPVGSVVRLTVDSADGGDPVTRSITRESVSIRTVRGYRHQTDDSWDYLYDLRHRIGYVRVTSFSPNTVRELRAVMDELTASSLKALVLDMRANPGGLLTSAVEVSDMFVETGTIVSTRGINVEPRRWKAHKAGTYSGFPMAVIVNRFSASGSEIVAACLQDHERAAIVGQRTWGKGTVQNILQLEDGRSALKLTTAEYYRPNGKTIDRKPNANSNDVWGVSPDEGLEFVMSDADSARLQRQRQARDRVRAAVRSANELQDPQLDLAIKHLLAEMGLPGK